MPTLADLPDELFSDPVALAVLEACAAYGGDAPADALEHAVIDDLEGAGSALAALQRAGVLEGGHAGAWSEAASALLADDPQRVARCERLCRYEGAVLQGWLLVSREQVVPQLQPRAEGAEGLVLCAVRHGAGRPAADLAGTVLASYARLGLPPERLVQVADLEVAAARRTDETDRLDRALANRAAVSAAAGEPERALADRLRLHHPTDPAGEVLPTVRVALEAGRPDVALTLLAAGWRQGVGTGAERLEVGLSLTQLYLEVQEIGSAKEVLDALPDAPEVAADKALLRAVADLEAAPGERARDVLAAVHEALDAGPPLMGRVLDRWVRLVRAGAVPAPVLLASVTQAGAAPDLPYRRAGFAIIQAFLGLWATAPDDPRTSEAARRADEVTGKRWRFEDW